MKNIPQRKCIGCNEKKDKKDFIRIVKDNQNNISIDKTGKANGRGAYICDNIDCLEKAIKNRNQIFDNDAFNDDLVIGFDK